MWKPQAPLAVILAPTSWGLPWWLKSVKNLPVMHDTWVRSLVGEDPPEKGMRTHSSILAWGIPWTEEPDGLQSMGVAKSGTPLSAFHFTYFNLIYLAAVGLACGPWRLQSLLWHWSSCGELLWHGTLVGNSCGIGTLVGNSCGIGPLVAACGVFIHCVWYLVPWPEMEPGLLCLECRVLAIAPPGKPLIFLF